MVTPVFKWVELYQYGWGAETFDLFILPESYGIGVCAGLLLLGGRKSQQLESIAPFEMQIVSSLMKRAIKNKIMQPSWLK